MKVLILKTFVEACNGAGINFALQKTSKVVIRVPCEFLISEDAATNVLRNIAKQFDAIFYCDKNINVYYTVPYGGWEATHFVFCYTDCTVLIKQYKRWLDVTIPITSIATAINSDVYDDDD